MIWGLNIRNISRYTARGQRFPLHRNFPELLRPLNLVFNGCCGSWSGVKRPGRAVDHLHLLPILGMSGSVPLFPLHAFMVWVGTALPLWRELRIYAFESHNELLIDMLFQSVIFSNPLTQCFSTAGPRPGTEPWHQLYRAARGSPRICHFSFLSNFHE